MNRLLVLSFIIALLAGPLAACGKKGDPKVPGESPYPRSYPKAK